MGCIIMQMTLLGVSDVIQHGGFFLLFPKFPRYFSFFPENLTFYSENTLFNSLTCKRCFNTSLCCFTITFGLESLFHNLSFNISYYYMPIFTKFTVNKCLEDKRTATEMDKCPDKILLKNKK